MIASLAQWQPLLLWLSGVSLLMALATVVCLPVVITRLPADYFAQKKRLAMHSATRQPVLSVLVSALKNILGAMLVLLGVIMLVTPGQGVLTILAGLMLMNFPGKYRLERWLVLRPGVLSALNWLRGLLEKEPFASPQ